MLTCYVQMLNLNPSHWLKSLKAFQPIWRFKEETHELLTEDDRSDHALTRWGAPKYGIPRVHLRNVHIKTLCGTLLLGLFAGIVLLHQRKAAPVVAQDPPKPWDDFRR